MRKGMKIVLPIFFVAVLIFIYSYNNRTQEIDPKLASFYDDEVQLVDLNEVNMPVVLTAYMSNCPACVKLEPELKEYQKKYEGKILFKYVNILENDIMAKTVPVRVTPTTFFFDKNMKPINFEKFNDSGLLYYNDKVTKNHKYTALEGYFDENTMNKIVEELLN